MAKDLLATLCLNIGCDPEIFITRVAGRVRKRVAAVSSELVVPPDGIGYSTSAPPIVTRDGVQVELHAGGHSGCRQSLAVSIKYAFTQLHNALPKARTALHDSSLAISFRPMIELTRGDIAHLSPEARELNCKPSLNAYGREPIHRDGSTYPIRTASGHLHLGTGLVNRIDPVDIVKVYDVLVGIPCVLVDQDPSQKIRRETYGLAGEYRLPPHGLEYRVPSNFWLLDYKLQSFVFGLARLAIRVSEGFIKNSKCTWAKNELLKKVDFVQVEQAINTNDFDLALHIYKESIRPFVDQVYGYYGFGEGLMDAFEYFVDRVHEKGLQHWFDVKDDSVLKRWLSLDYTSTSGWESFLLHVVERQRKAARFTGIILDPVRPVARRRSRATVETELRIAA